MGAITKRHRKFVEKPNTWPNMTFAERLKETREDKQLKQHDMARFCGIAVGTYANWEQGRVQTPVNYLPILADTLNVSTDYLLGFSKKQEAERIAERFLCLPEKTQEIMLQLIEILAEKRA